MPTIHEEDGMRTVTYTGDELDALLEQRPRWRLSLSDVMLGPLVMTWGLSEAGRIHVTVFWKDRRLV